MIAKVSPQKKDSTKMPLVPMRGVVLFPNTINHFDAGRERTIKALEQAFENGTPVFLVCQKEISTDEPTGKDLYGVGVVATVKQMLRFSENVVKVLVECDYRGKLRRFYDEGNCCYGDVSRAPVRGVPRDRQLEADAAVGLIRSQIDIYTEHYPKLVTEVIDAAFREKNYQRLAEYIAFALPIDYTYKQEILEESSLLKRLNLLLSILVKENDVLAIEREISDKVRDQIDKGQRDYYLREQIRALSEELGEGSEIADVDEYRQKVNALPLAEEHKKRVLKEVDRLALMQGNTQEASVIRTYLDTVVDLPWNVFTEDRYDLKSARRILDREHYGLEKVKERILEYLAVRSLTDEINAQIICLVGPPGVGKTSIARAIAECMDKKFVRMSLGGIRDEAEIRGHRRTYVGSMPGRIISAIEQAGSSNPLILLDEVDKLGNDYKGDPASALLEVLDPEQNSTFRDHFLDIPYDLSKVLFITTANNPSSIPEPLYDRMDVIELSSYTRLEKFKIAKLHLLAKQLKKHGLDKTRFTITDSALYELIDDYTEEAGVRTLERQLAKLIRKAARLIVEKQSDVVRVDCTTLEKLLGPKAVKDCVVEHRPQVGVVNGLAWTAVGGVLMPIETVAVKGTGKIETTGSLGDVMKESAKLALSLARTLEGRGIPEKLLTEYDIHIHAPEGAVPKDGPSAGVTLLTALVSAVTNTPVRKDLAMTGEITLKGRVLPIGGLKEKLIAAYKEKMTTVLIPRANLEDLADVSDEVKNALKIIPVERVSEVLNIALEKNVKSAHKLSPKNDGAKRTNSPVC